MICAHCEHPIDWHGDRAVCPCDGGWDTTKSLNRFTPQNRNGSRPVSLCGCPGWRGVPEPA